MTEIHNLSAVELLQRYRAKTLSPTEVFAAIEHHIARWEPHLKALYAYAPETARREAAASTERGRAFTAYVVNGSSVDPRTVTVLRRGRDQVAIAAGLREGERVSTKDPEVEAPTK